MILDVWVQGQEEPSTTSLLCDFWAWPGERDFLSGSRTICLRRLVSIRGALLANLLTTGAQAKFDAKTLCSLLLQPPFFPPPSSFGHDGNELTTILTRASNRCALIHTGALFNNSARRRRDGRRRGPRPVITPSGRARLRSSRAPPPTSPPSFSQEAASSCAGRPTRRHPDSVYLETDRCGPQ